MTNNDLKELLSTDCHIHPSYSIDAKGFAEEFVESAIKKKLKKICFTTHIDFNPVRIAMDPFIRVNGNLYLTTDKRVKIYVDEINFLKEKYRDKIEVVMGFEFSYVPSIKGLLERFIGKFNPEFTIGSIHSINSINITSRSELPVCLRCFKPEDFIPRYYNSIIELEESGLFTVIGHFDGYKKYLQEKWGKERIEDIESKILPEVARELGSMNSAIEINTAAIRKGLGNPYPALPIIGILLEYGVKIVCIGSDAHSPEFVAANFDNVASFFERSEP